VPFVVAVSVAPDQDQLLAGADLVELVDVVVVERVLLILTACLGGLVPAHERRLARTDDRAEPEVWQLAAPLAGQVVDLASPPAVAEQELAMASAPRNRSSPSVRSTVARGALVAVPGLAVSSVEMGVIARSSSCAVGRFPGRSGSRSRAGAARRRAPAG
jgi:hypothetical protein